MASFAALQQLCSVTARDSPRQRVGQRLSSHQQRSSVACSAGTRERLVVEAELRDAPNPSDGRSEPDVPLPSLERVSAQAWSQQDVWQTLKIVQKSILRQLASLPLAVGEMSLVAALSVIGTLITQNEAPSYYLEHYPTDAAQRTSSWLDANLILGLQWDHIYTADYFLGLLALLAASLAACSYTRQWPMVRVARRWRFASNPTTVLSRAAAAQDAVTVPDASVRSLGRALLGQGYQVFLRQDHLYAFKGLAGKYGPLGVHASMLAIMAGVAWGGLAGSKGTVTVPLGAQVQFVEAMRGTSALAPIPDGAQDAVRVDDFRVKYRADGSTEQFVSQLSVVGSNGQVERQQEISVNHPLHYKGVTAYQADFAMSAVTLRVEGSSMYTADQRFNLPMADLASADGVQGKLWGTFLPLAQPEPGQAPPGISLLARDFQTVTLYQRNGEFAGVRRFGSNNPITIGDVTIWIDGAVGASGLELKADPGVPLVYTGFGGMMLTTLLSYLSHSQVWATQQGSTVHVAGRSNKAKVEFSGELEDMLLALPQTPTAAGSGTGSS